MKIFLFIIAFCLGGAALGLGWGAGNSLALHFLPQTEVIVETQQEQTNGEITTVHVNPLVVPVDTQEPNFVDIIPQVQSAVVSIYVTSPMGRSGSVPGSGSGFIFEEDEEYIYIATNNHVIENTNTIFISLDDVEQVKASVVGHDRNSDVAVIAASREEMEALETPFTVASLGDSDALRMGDPVIAIGNAMGEGKTVTRGIISALALNIEIADRRDRIYLDVLQTDAAVNRGNSGGPLINQNGEVIGIVTAKLIGADIEGMGYALPMNHVRPLLDDILETGNVRRAYIGIIPEEINEFVRELFNLPSVGVLVKELAVDYSPAEEAGILRGDLIIAFDGEKIENIDDLQAALDRAAPGDEVILLIYRSGKQLEITVALGTRMN